MFRQLERDLTEILPGQLISIGHTKAIHNIIMDEVNILQKNKNAPVLPISLVPITCFKFQDSLQSWNLIRSLESIAKNQLCIILLLFEFDDSISVGSLLKQSPLNFTRDATDKIILISEGSNDVLNLNLIKNRAGNIGEISFDNQSKQTKDLL